MWAGDETEILNFPSFAFLLFSVPQGGGATDVRGVQAEDRGTLHSFRPQMDDLCPNQV